MDGISDISKRMCRLCMNEEDVVLYVINENPGFRNYGMPLSWRIMMCVGIAVRTRSYVGTLIIQAWDLYNSLICTVEHSFCSQS